MVTVPSSGERRILPSEMQVPNTGGLGATPDAFGLIGARDLMQTSELVGQLAEREVEELRKQARVNLMTEVSQFAIESRERLLEIKREGTGERSFTAVVMEDTQRRADELIANQPKFLQAEATMRLLPQQVSVAKSAIAIQEADRQAELQRDRQTFLNNTINQLRFGDLDEEVALEQARTFASQLPADQQRDAEFEFTQAIRASSLYKLVDENPQEAIEAIRGGKFNDLDPSVVSRQYSLAKRALLKGVATPNKALKQAKKARIEGDNAKFAELLLQAQGVANPTRLDIIKVQEAAGIPKSAIRVLNKEDAQLVARSLTEAEDLTSLGATLTEIRTQFASDGIDPDLAMKDVIELGDMPVAVAFVADMTEEDLLKAPSDSGVFLGVNAVLQMTRDPDAPKKAMDVIKNREFDDLPGAKEDINTVVEDAIGDLSKAASAAGVDIPNIAEIEGAIRGVSQIVYADELTRTGSTSKAKKAAQRAVEGLLELKDDIVVTEQDAYVLPKEITAVLDEDAMGALREQILEKTPLFLPATFPDEELLRKHYERVAGWVRQGDDLVLVTGVNTVGVAPQPILQADGSMIKIPLEDLEAIALRVSELTSQSVELPQDEGISVIEAMFGFGGVTGQPSVNPSARDIMSVVVSEYISGKLDN